MRKEILIIDDRETDIYAIKQVLGLPGYNYTWAKKEKDALSLLKAKEFNLIIVDHQVTDERSVHRIMDSMTTLQQYITIVYSENDQLLEYGRGQARYAVLKSKSVNTEEEGPTTLKECMLKILGD